MRRIEQGCSVVVTGIHLAEPRRQEYYAVPLHNPKAIRGASWREAKVEIYDWYASVTLPSSKRYHISLSELPKRYAVPASNVRAAVIEALDREVKEAQERALSEAVA